MSTIEERNKEIVRHVYEASAGGDANAFVSVMHEDIEELVPPILPGGGVHRGSEVFMTKVIPLVAAASAASGSSVCRRTGIGVAALSTGRSTSGKELRIAEHWKPRDGKVLSIMVFYHDTTPLMRNATAQG